MPNENPPVKGSVENLKKLHAAMVEDSVFRDYTHDSFSDFVSHYAKDNLFAGLHQMLVSDEVYKDHVPADIGEAMEFFGINEIMGKKPSAPSPGPSGARGEMQQGGLEVGFPSALPSPSGGKVAGGVDSGAISRAAGITEQDKAQLGEIPTEGEAAPKREVVDNARSRRIEGEIQNVQTFLEKNLGAEMTGRILRNEELSYSEWQDLMKRAKESGIKAWVDIVDKMSLTSPQSSLMEAFTGQEGVAKFANADALEELISRSNQQAVIAEGERGYAETKRAVEQRFGAQNAEQVMRNQERTLGLKFLPESDKKIALLNRELNALITSENPDMQKLSELEAQISELSNQSALTLYDPRTGEFISGNQQEMALDVIEFNEGVEEVAKEAMKTDYQVLLEMRRRAFFAMEATRNRFQERDRNFPYGPESASYQRVVVPLRRQYEEALKQFMGINRAIELNIDPGKVARQKEWWTNFKQGAIEQLVPAYMLGAPGADDPLFGKKLSEQADRAFVEAVTTVFQNSGIALTEEQEERLKLSFTEQAGGALGNTVGIGVKLMAMTFAGNKAKAVLEIPKFARAVQAMMGTRFGATGNVVARVGLGIASSLEGGLYYSAAGSSVATGVGERVSEKLYDKLIMQLIKGSPGGRMAELLYQMGRTTAAVGSQTIAEYVGEFTDNFVTLGIGNWEEVVETTFGSTGDEKMDKLLLTVLTVLPFQGFSDVGKFLAIGFKPQLRAALAANPDNAAIQEALELVGMVEAGENMALMPIDEAKAKAEAQARKESDAEAKKQAEREAEEKAFRESPAGHTAQMLEDTAPVQAEGEVATEVDADTKTPEDRAEGAVVEGEAGVAGIGGEAAVNVATNPALQTVEATTEALEGRTGKVLSEPTAEQKAEDARAGNTVTFTYEKDSEVPAAFQEKVTSRGEVNGKPEIRVTMSKSEADYLLMKDNPQAVAEAYHKAKAEGISNSLTEAVESLVAGASVDVATNPSLQSVDATAEALENEVEKGLKFNAEFNLPLEQAQTSQQVADAYHKAKADGSNPELVQAVEQLLTPKTETDAVQEQEAGQVPLQPEAGVGQEVAQGVPETGTQQVAGEGEAQVEGEATQKAVADAAPKVEAVPAPSATVTDAEIQAERKRLDKPDSKGRVETVKDGGSVMYERVNSKGETEYKIKPPGGRAAIVSKADYEAAVRQALANQIALKKLGLKPSDQIDLNSKETTSNDIQVAAAARMMDIDAEGNLTPEADADIQQNMDADIAASLEGESEVEVSEAEVDSVSDSEMGIGESATKKAQKEAKSELDSALKSFRETLKRNIEASRNLGVVFDARAKAERDFELFQATVAVARAFINTQVLNARVAALQYNDYLRAINKELKSLGISNEAIRDIPFDTAYNMAIAESLDPNFANPITDVDTYLELVSSPDAVVAAVEAGNALASQSRETMGEKLSKFWVKSMNLFYDRQFQVSKMARAVGKHAGTAAARLSLSDFMNAVGRMRDFGTRVDRKWKTFERVVYGGLSKAEAAALDLAIYAESIISLEQEVEKRAEQIKKDDAEIEAAMQSAGVSFDNLKEARDRFVQGRSKADEASAWSKVADAMGKSDSELVSMIKSRNNMELRNEEILGETGSISHGKMALPNNKVVVLNRAWAETYLEKLSESKNKNLKKLNKTLDARLAAYWSHNNELLLEQVNNKVISEELYNQLKDRKYMRRSWSDDEIQYFSNLSNGVMNMEMFTGSKSGGMGGNTGVLYSLKGGSDGYINTDSRLAARMNTIATYRRIANEGMLRSMSEDLLPLYDNYLMSLLTGMIDKGASTATVATAQSNMSLAHVLEPKSFDKYGKPVYDTTGLPAAISKVVKEKFTEVDFHDAQGRPRRMYINNGFLEQLQAYGRGDTVMDRLGKTLGLIMFSTVMKAKATGIHMAFAYFQIFADAAHRATASDAHGKSFFVSYLRGFAEGHGISFMKLASDVSNGARGLLGMQKKEGWWDATVNDAIDHGFNMSTMFGEFTDANARRVSLGKIGDSGGSSMVGNAFKGVMSVLQYAPEVTEISGRISVYRALLRKSVAKHKKDNQGAVPSQEQLAKYKQRAAAAANNVMNYGVSGTAKPVLEAIMPFYNAAFRAFRGQVEGARTQGAWYWVKHAEAIGGMTLLAIIRKKIEEDDEENDIRSGLQARDLYRSFNIPLGVVAMNPKTNIRERLFLSIPTMSNFDASFMQLTAEVFADAFMAKPSNAGLFPFETKISLKDFATVLSQQGPLANPLTAAPLLSASIIMFGNYHPFYGQKVWRGDNNLSTAHKADETVHRAIAEVARLLPQDAENMSAKQLQEALNAVFILNDPATSALLSGIGSVINLIAGPSEVVGVGEDADWNGFEKFKKKFIKPAGLDFEGQRKEVIALSPSAGGMALLSKNLARKMVLDARSAPASGYTLVEADKKATEFAKAVVDAMKDKSITDAEQYRDIVSDLVLTPFEINGSPILGTINMFRSATNRNRGVATKETSEMLMNGLLDLNKEAASYVKTVLVLSGMFDPNYRVGQRGNAFMAGMYKANSNFSDTELFRGLMDTEAAFRLRSANVLAKLEDAGVRDKLVSAYRSKFGDTQYIADDVNAIMDKFVRISYMYSDMLQRKSPLPK